MTRFDLVVLGAGAAGSLCAHTLNQNGYNVAVIERDKLGGTCLNYGCDPTKTALHTAHLLHQAQNGRHLGLQIEQASASWPLILERVEEVLQTMRGGTLAEARQAMRDKGMTLYKGEAAFISPNAVEVNGETIEADRFLIATGAKATIPPIEGLDQISYRTDKTIFNMAMLPATIGIIGGGPIGVEFSQLFSRLGSDVTLFEATEHILPKDDPELASELAEILSGEGVQIFTQTQVKRVKALPEGMDITAVFESGYEQRVLVDELLIAAGRQSAIEALNLEAAGVEVEDGFVKTDETLGTTVDHIWAAGDVTAKMRFTHMASRQGRHVAQSIMAGERRPYPHDIIPWVTYTEPELAHVGRSEAELVEEGVSYSVYTQTFDEVARAKTTGKVYGRAKLFVDEDDKVLGGQLLAANGGELIAPIILAMKCGIPFSALDSAVWPYPTMSAVWGKLEQNG